MKIKVVIGIIILVAVGAGVYFLISQKKSTENIEKVVEKNEMMEKDRAMKETGYILKGGEMMGEDSQMIDDKMGKSSYGKVISGKNSSYVEFKKVGYDKAIADGKIVFLDFFANWCPICRAEAPIISSGFESLRGESVVGFRVNFKDSDTDTDENAMAALFKVPYQHTKIILVKGKEIVRYTDSWEKSDFDAAFEKVLK